MQWRRDGFSIRRPAHVLGARMHTHFTSAVLARFWSKVDKGDGTGCWLWTASKVKDGYGRFHLNGKNRPAQQVAWEIAYGFPFPEGMLGCHTCDNPPCVRPEHVFPGTIADNAADMRAKGRANDTGARGDANGTHTRPDRIARGDRHYSKTRPECVARGARQGLRKHPELVRRGERSNWAKLSADVVQTIRALRVTGMSYKALGQRFKIDPETARRIALRKTWAHIP